MIFKKENMLQKAGEELPDLNAAFLANNLWLLIATSMVFLTNAGLTLFKTVSGDCVLRSVATLILPTLAYWFLGYSVMYGDSVADGWLYFAGLFFDPEVTAETIEEAGLTPTVDFLFQAMFVTMASCIATMGSVSKINSILFSFIFSTIIYPVSGSWEWNGGWLNSVGDNEFIDFAGSSIVFLTGGVAALVNGSFVEPTTNMANYKKNMYVLATMLMIFGHLGVNAGSQLAMDQWVPYLACTTLLSIGGAVLSTILLSASYQPDSTDKVHTVLMGALSGAIGSSAACGNLTLSGSFLSGLVAGFIGWFINRSTKNILRQIVNISTACGIWGSLVVGLWGYDIQGDGSELGLFNGGGISQLGIQALGTLAYTVYPFITTNLFKLVIKNEA